MTVYVDDAQIPATVPNGRARHSSTWSHLFADSQEELHEFAERLGLRRSYFQPGRPRGDGSPSRHWHYDVTSGKRQQAVALGAQAVSWRESVEIMRRRDAAEADQAAGRAYRDGDLGKAVQLLAQAHLLDPERADTWEAHERQVRQARQDAERGMTLAGQTRARLAAAGIGPDDPGMQQLSAWNAAVLSRAANRAAEIEATA